MAYVLNGVGVEVSPQATRPREPARPSRAMVLRSPEMATRQLRPRENVPYTFSGLGTVMLTPAIVKGPVVKVPVVTKTNSTVPAPNLAHVNGLLSKVALAKGQQASLEALLKNIANELAASKAVLQRAILKGSKTDISRAEANVASIGKAVDVCIAAIKACAAKANVAADSAIGAGATRTVVEKAAAAGTATPVALPTSMTIPIKATLPPSLPPPASLPPTVAVETNTVSVTPGGQVTVGPDAVVVETPSQADPSAPPFAAQDVTVSSGSLGTLALVGVAGFLGYMMLRKKGRV